MFARIAKVAHNVKTAYHIHLPAAIRNLADIWVGKDLVDVPSFGLSKTSTHKLVGLLVVIENGKQTQYNMVSNDHYRFVNPTSSEIAGMFEEIRKLDMQPLSIELFSSGKSVFLQDSEALALAKAA